MWARCAPKPNARETAATASPARKYSSPTASTTSPTTSCISCWRAWPTRRPARAAFLCSWCRSSWSTPTCTMVYGDHGGAIGYLVGEENRGLACMFTMMNNARLAVGLQGVAIAERATQQALAYARERRQGRAVGASGSTSPIIAHADVRRMLLTMRVLTHAARAICYATAAAIDRSHRAADAAARQTAHERASLLTPV